MILILSTKQELKIFTLLGISKLEIILKISFLSKLFILLDYNLIKKSPNVLFFKNIGILAIY